jgi:hypothetical protein
MTQVFAEGVVIPTLFDGADVTKKVTLSTTGITSGVTHQLTWSGAASVMTFPSGTSVVAALSLVQTMTNKTFTSSTMDDSTNVVRATKLATSVGGSPVVITLSVPVAGQTLLATSGTAMAYTTIDLAKILTIGATSGGTNIQMTGGSDLVLTTSASIITSLETIPVTIKAADSVSANTSGAVVTIDGGQATGTGNGGSITLTAGKVGTGTSGSIILDVNSPASGASTYGSIDLRGHLKCDYAGLPTISRASGVGAISISPDSNDTSGNASVGPNTVLRVTFFRPYPAGTNVRVIPGITTDAGANALADKWGVINDTATFFDFSNGTASRTLAFNYFVIQR